MSSGGTTSTPSSDPPAPPSQSDAGSGDGRLLAGLGGGASGEEDARELDYRDVARLAWRTLPYLRPFLRELRPLGIVTLLLLVIGLPATMLGTDLLFTRMLGGEPLTEFQATLLRLDPAVFVVPDTLSFEARQLLRGRLLRDIGLVTLVLLPLSLWMIWVFIRIQQRINQLLRVEMMEQVEAMSMRFHNASRIGDSVYRTYQDSAMVTRLMGMLARPILPTFDALFGVFFTLLFDWRLSAGLVVCYLAAFFVAQRFTRELRPAFRDAREKNSVLTSRIQETLAGIRVVKAYGVEAFEQGRFETASQEAFAGARRARAVSSLSSAS